MMPVLKSFTRRTEQGFTLIEVLVALTVFSVAAIAASSASRAYITSVDRLRTKTYAHFVAQNAVADMRMQGVQQSGSSTQRVSEQGREWQIKTKAVPTASKSLKRLEVNVSEVDGNATRSVYDMVVFIAQPQSGSAPL